jgi:hypothetical protein
MENMAADLPFVDEHAIGIAAPRAVVWAVLHRYAAAMAGHDSALLGAALGAQPRSGFALAEVADGAPLRLRGQHRFSRYELVFAVADGPAGGSLVVARTFAEFPGLRGRVYRMLVIGTRLHVLATRRMLSAVRRLSQPAAN